MKNEQLNIPMCVCRTHNRCDLAAIFYRSRSVVKTSCTLSRGYLGYLAGSMDDVMRRKSLKRPYEDYSISAIFASDPQFTSTEGNVSFKIQCFMPNERSHFIIPNTIVASVSAFGIWESVSDSFRFPD
ncbi:hypothetical protein OUZ56_020547 [Daphnia magna]|uniref:Uncharacterized protein n=1 Tax=Daphnia magna TaxID=35525 RepID=A0ABQ9ZES5_9CRUS|nr:hypothetical protein OUZ56_020547 [Daphnia magna]